jgi:hypothetical protein
MKKPAGMHFILGAAFLILGLVLVFSRPPAGAALMCLGGLEVGFGALVGRRARQAGNSYLWGKRPGHVI